MLKVRESDCLTTDRTVSAQALPEQPDAEGKRGGSDPIQRLSTRGAARIDYISRNVVIKT